jgi:hypothetical protein
VLEVVRHLPSYRHQIVVQMIAHPLVFVCGGHERPQGRRFSHPTIARLFIVSPSADSDAAAGLVVRSITD